MIEFDGVELTPCFGYTVSEVIRLMINTSSLISMTDAKQSFLKVARLADEHGVAVILKNNVPRYVLLEFSQFQDVTIADEASVLEAGRMFLSEYRRAFEELAK